jgi:hypothetical protein
MAVDYKTLQALAVSQPRDAEGYCPECGRPWCAPAPDRPPPEAAFPWRAAFLVAVGLAIAITFGVRATRASQRQVAIQRDLVGLTRCLGGVSGDRTCPAGKDAEDLREIDNIDAATARGQRDRALVAAALGLLALGVGLRALARRGRRRDRSRSTLMAAWDLGESLVALTCLQILALILSPIAGQLSRGLPMTWERLDRATDGVLVLVSLLTGSPP